MNTLDAELRAKYSSDALKAMVKSGEAMTNANGDPSFPIKDVADLKRAIRAVGRAGADHDKVRKHIIARAKAIGHSDLIPDNWNADGSLEAKSGEWTVENRETVNDLSVALSAAVQELVESMDGVYYAWVQDFDVEKSEVYFQAGDLLFAASFTVIDDGPLTLGDPRRVRPITSYVPADAGERAEGDEPATREVSDGRRSQRRRVAQRTQEWREQRAIDQRASERKRAEPRPQRIVPVEVREDREGAPIVSSYASLFNTPYIVGTGAYRYEETVQPRAFRRSLSAEPDVVFRTEHRNAPLARTTAGNLKLIEDERGLRYEATLDPDDPDVQALVPKIRSGNYRESSFAFRAIEDEWNDDFTRRSLTVCELDRGDVSVVTFGASPATGLYMQLRSEEVEALRSIGLKGLVEAFVEWRDYTLFDLEERAGRKLSSATLEVLKHVLSLASTADDALDEIQPTLADLLGVPNPDADDDDGDSDDSPDEDEDGNGDGDGDSRAAPSPSVPKAPGLSIREIRRELRGF